MLQLILMNLEFIDAIVPLIFSSTGVILMLQLFFYALTGIQDRQIIHFYGVLKTSFILLSMVALGKIYTLMQNTSDGEIMLILFITVLLILTTGVLHSILKSFNVIIMK